LGGIVLIPDYLTDDLVAALTDMGGDIRKGKNPIIKGLFQGQFVVAYKEGIFLDLHCRHDSTMATLRQIVDVIMEAHKNADI
jgi:hypothetical protein